MPTVALPPALRELFLLISVHRRTEVARRCPTLQKCTLTSALAVFGVCTFLSLRLAHNGDCFGMQFAQFIDLATEREDLGGRLEMGSSEFGAGLAHGIGKAAKVGRVARIDDDAAAHLWSPDLGFLLAE